MDEEHARSQRRLWLPVATVTLALGLSIVAPIALRSRELDNRRDLQQTIYPLRSALQTQKSAIQSGVAARAGFIASGNPEMLERAQDWSIVAETIQPEIAELIARSPAAIQSAYQDIVASQREVAALRPSADLSDADLFALLPEVDERQNRVLAAYERADSVLAEEIADREERLDSLESIGGTAAVLLGALGLLAVFSVARLARAESRARREAEAAVGVRDRVVSIVSHDLRNPLNTISLAAGFVLDQAQEAGEPLVVRHLEIIRRATGNMNRMIGDLLDVARMESGKLSIEARPTEVGRLIEDVETQLGPVVEEKGLTLECRADPPLPTVLVDPDRTLQILSNLVGNAVKFSPPGGTIRVLAVSDGAQVWFQVSDTGDGIPPDDLPHLFDRFWQASRSDRRGIGLGLPIVKHLVEAQGGVIEVSSRVGEGSTFRFSVPTPA